MAYTPYVTPARQYRRPSGGTYGPMRPSAAGGASNAYAKQQEFGGGVGGAQYGGADSLLGGGGVSEGAIQGEQVDPRGMPVWDPYSKKTGLGTSYLNLLRPPSEAGAQTVGALQNTVLGNLGRDTRRPVSGIGEAQFMDPQNAARQMQLGAAAGVQNAGMDARAQQAMLPGQLRADSTPFAASQMGLVAEGANVGRPVANQQTGLSALLAARSLGQGPSAAQATLQQGLARNVGAQMGIAANARGGSAAGAMRGAQLQGAQMGLQTQAQSAALAAQEQQAAQELYSQHLGLQRGQDVATLGMRGDLAAQGGASALARNLGVGQLSGAMRGQDIEQAMGAAGVIQGMRGQDQNLISMAGDLGLRSRGMDDQLAQQDIMNALGLGGLQLQGGQADAQTMLGAAGTVNDYLLGRRQADISKQLGNRELGMKEIEMYWGMGQDYSNMLAGGFGGAA